MAIHQPQVNPKPLHAGFLVETVALRQIVLSAAVLSRQYLSTNAPYTFINPYPANVEYRVSSK